MFICSEGHTFESAVLIGQIRYPTDDAYPGDMCCPECFTDDYDTAITCPTCEEWTSDQYDKCNSCGAKLNRCASCEDYFITEEFNTEHGLCLECERG